MALLVKERVPQEERSARFRGLAFADEAVTVRSETCGLCHNRCHLSLIASGGGEVAWGLKCGREYEDRKGSRDALDVVRALAQAGKGMAGGCSRRGRAGAGGHGFASASCAAWAPTAPGRTGVPSCGRWDANRC